MKKVSRFEFAIMQIADPEGAKNAEPYTEAEEFKMRQDNVNKQLSRFKGKDGQPVALLYPHPLSENRS